LSSIENEILTKANADTAAKIQAVKLIFENFFKLTGDVRKLIVQLSKKREPIEVRMLIAETLLQPNNLDNWTLGAILDALSYSEEIEVKRIVEKYKGMKHYGEHFLNEWGRCPTCHDQDIKSKVWAEFDKTSQQYVGLRCDQGHSWPWDLRHQLWIKVTDAEEIIVRLQSRLQELKQRIKPPLPSDIDNPESINDLDQITTEINNLNELNDNFFSARDYLRDYYESH